MAGINHILPVQVMKEWETTFFINLLRNEIGIFYETCHRRDKIKRFSLLFIFLSDKTKKKITKDRVLHKMIRFTL